MSRIATVTLEHSLQPGDLGMVVHLHGAIYGAEYGLDATFEPYVARPLSDFVLAGEDSGRIWLAKIAGADGRSRIVGSIAVIKTEADTNPSVGQLRWFLVTPEARGTGTGRRLMDAALAYARAESLASLYLWTFRELHAAIHLYRSYGFVLTEETTHNVWGATRTEQRFDLTLRSS